MIRSLFDDIEEEPQTKIEKIIETEVQSESKVVPEAEMLPGFAEGEEISLETPALSDSVMTEETTGLSDLATTIERSDISDAAENIESPFMPIEEATTEINHPTGISSLHDAEIIEEPAASPEIPFLSDAKKIDELRMQSNIANTRDPQTIPEITNESVKVRAKTESIAETSRKSGLAYAAAITLFASVAFLLIIGWFADLLMGTSPWGKVGGIVLGSLIGFFQFFRMTSQILKDKD